MKINKFILASLLVTKIAEASSFSKFDEPYNVYIEFGDIVASGKFSDLCEDSKEDTGFYDKNNESKRKNTCIFGTAMIEKNTGACVFINNKIGLNQRIIHNKESFTPQFFLALKDRFDNQFYSRSKFENALSSSNIYMTERDCSGLNDKQPWTQFLVKILKSETKKPLCFKEKIVCGDSLEFKNSQKGFVVLSTSKNQEKNIGLKEMLLGILEGESKTLLEKSSILSVWCVEQYDSKVICVGLAKMIIRSYFIGLRV